MNHGAPSTSYPARQPASAFPTGRHGRSRSLGSAMIASTLSQSPSWTSTDAAAAAATLPPAATSTAHVTLTSPLSQDDLEFDLAFDDEAPRGRASTASPMPLPLPSPPPVPASRTTVGSGRRAAPPAPLTLPAASSTSEKARAPDGGPAFATVIGVDDDEDEDDDDDELARDTALLAGSGAPGGRVRRAPSTRNPAALPLSPLSPRFARAIAHGGRTRPYEVPEVPAFPFLRGHEDRLGWFRWLADVHVEQHGKRRLLISFLFWALCGQINIIFCNIADRRRIELAKNGIPFNARLPDLGHDLIPHLKTPHLPDYFIVTLTVLTVLMTLRHKHRMGLLRRYLYVHGTLLLLRSVTIVATTLPDPQEMCMARDPASRDVNARVNPFAPDTCADLVFSGHTVVLTLMASVWNDYGPQHPWIQRGIWALAFGGMWSLLAMRYHYTIDVIIAYYIALKAWKWYGYLALYPHMHDHDPLVGFLERRSSASDLSHAVAQFRATTRAKESWLSRARSAAESALTAAATASAAGSSGVSSSSGSTGTSRSSSLAHSPVDKHQVAMHDTVVDVGETAPAPASLASNGGVSASRAAEQWEQRRQIRTQMMPGGADKLD
ncbi:hypothetical protein GGF31_003837 [Allomyces arbusculus]|nr:hypothetical protein GGF31_003837 [Allomyces arbusculus]